MSGASTLTDQAAEYAADCNVVPELTDGDDFDNFVSIGGALFEQHDADVVTDYDRALAQMDAAIASAIGEPA